MTRRCLRLGLVFPLLAGCASSLGFKSVVFEGVNAEQVFPLCEEQIRRHYTGLVIRADPDLRQVETDPIEFAGREGTLREQVFLDVREREDGTVEIALFVPMSRLHVEPEAQNPYQWKVLRSDEKVEQILLEEITGSVLLSHPTASVRPD